MIIRQFCRNSYLSLTGNLVNPKPGIHILNAHYTSPLNKNSDLIERQMKKLRKYCSFILFEEAVSRIINTQIPKKEVCVAFSYDDGFEECFSIIAPVLEQFNTNAAFFINSGFIDNSSEYWNQRRDYKDSLLTTSKKPMSWNQIKELHQRGHIIGSHTADHINLNTTDLEFAESQILNCKERIEEMVGNSCEYFAFPYGNLHHINEETLEIAQKFHPYIFSGTNYKHYFSLNGKIINRRHIEPFWPFSHVKYFLSHKKEL